MARNHGKAHPCPAPQPDVVESRRAEHVRSRLMAQFDVDFNRESEKVFVEIDSLRQADIAAVRFRTPAAQAARDAELDALTRQRLLRVSRRLVGHLQGELKALGVAPGSVTVQ
jgi:hypothetical protein